jgi:exopolysaccharide biosynthesis polyprenyl glycosylphosphotransferase
MQLTMWAGDVIAILLSVQIAVLLSTGRMLSITSGFKSITVGYCFFLTLLFYITDLYNQRRDLHSHETSSLVVLDSAISAAFVTLSFYFIPHWSIGRTFFLIIFLVTPGLVMTERLLCSRLQVALTRPSTLGVLGDGPGIEELRKVASEHKLKIISLPMTKGAQSSPDQGPSGPLRDGPVMFQEAMTHLRPDIIVLGPSASPDPTVARALIDARFSGVTVLDFPTTYQMLSGKLPLEHMDGQWFLSAQGFQFFESNMAVRMKRLLDLSMALVLLLVTSPLLPIIALGIKFSSKGPVLYIQERVGQNGQVFHLFKFRTMSVGADSEGPWTMENDPRVFRFGSFLRLTRFDELPQLINVLKGDMSFVGPRPLSLALAQVCRDATPYYNLRSAVRPGLTGWAQVNYRYGSSVQDEVEKLKYDLHYIQHLSLLLDVQIVLKTFRTVLGGRGSQ